MRYVAAVDPAIPTSLVTLVAYKDTIILSVQRQPDGFRWSILEISEGRVVRCSGVTSPEKRAVSNSKDDIELLTDNSDVCGNSGVVLYEDAPISDNVSHLGVKGQRAMKFTIRREEAEPVEQTTEFQLEAVSEGVALYAMQKGSPQRYRILTVRPNKPILRHPGVPEFLGLPVNSAGYVLID